MYDVDYEIYKYINEQADQYIELDELLKQHHLTVKGVRYAADPCHCRSSGTVSAAPCGGGSGHGCHQR